MEEKKKEYETVVFKKKEKSPNSKGSSHEKRPSLESKLGELSPDSVRKDRPRGREKRHSHTSSNHARLATNSGNSHINNEKESLSKSLKNDEKKMKSFLLL